MKFVKNLSRSKVARVLGLALVLASVVSFQHPVSADAGNGDHDLYVVVFNGDPINDLRVAGATLTVHSNDPADEGLTGASDNTGSFLFHIHGTVTVTISHPSFYTQDFLVIADAGVIGLEAPMIPIVTSPPPPNPTPNPTPTPTPTPGPTPSPSPTPNPTECTPTPPRGQPMFNIWPISTTGADCTDYPMLMVRNVTKNTNFVSNATVQADPGDVIRMRLYIHNGVLDFPENIAKNVRAKAYVPATVGQSVLAAGFSADNHVGINSSQKGGDSTVIMSGNGTLSLIPGSVTLYDRGPSNARGISDSIVTSDVNIGDMRGCFPFLHFITLDLKVNGQAVNPPPPPVVNPPPVTPPPVTPPPVTPPAAGIISISKNARNITQGQVTFVPSVSANPGDQIEFQMPVTASSGAVSNVIFSDSLPSRLVYVTNSLTVDGTPSGNNLGVLSLGNFNNNQTKTVVVRATVAASNQFSVGNTTLTNLANVTSSSNSASASANVLVNIQNVTPSVSLAINKQVRNITQNQSGFVKSTNANPGDLVQFQIQVSASGNTAAQNVSVADTLPANMSFVSGLSTTNLGNINAGSSQTITLTASIGSENQFACGTSTLTNQAQAQAANANTVFDSASINVNRTNCGGGGSVNLTLTKNVRNLTQGQNSFAKSTTANPNDQVQYQIVVTANGSIAAQNVQITDTLPNNFTLVSGSNSTNIGTLNPGASQTVTITAQVGAEGNFPSGTSNWPNTANATSSNAGSASDTATVVVNRNIQSNAQLSLTKEVRNLNSGNSTFSNFSNASNNDRVEFRIVVRNVSTTTVNNVRLTDALPSQLVYVPGTFSIDGSSSSGNLFNGGQFLGSLFPNNSRTILFQATVNTSTTQTLINQTDATADNASGVHAQATVFVSVSGNINLVLTKRAFNQTKNRDATTIAAVGNDVIVYTLRAQNQGNAAATNFQFQDDISQILKFSQLQNFGDANFDLTNLRLTWPVTTIPAGGYVEKTFSVLVSPNAVSCNDNSMINSFGNTVSIHVARVCGLVAPPTGSATAMLSFVLATGAAAGFWVSRKGSLSLLVKLISFNKNV